MRVGLLLVALAAELPALAGELPDGASVPDDAIVVIDDGPSPPPPWTPRARAAARLDLRLGVDTLHDRAGEPVVDLTVGARLELEVELTPELSAFAAPQLAYVAALEADGDDRGFLSLLPPEAHLGWTRGPLHLRAGTLVFAWGSSDLVAPADVLNPLDLRGGGFLAGQSAKIPVPAVEAVLGAGPLTLRGVVQPFFTPSRFFLVGWDFALLEGGASFALPDLEGLLSRASIDHHADLLLLTRRPADRLDALTLGGRATLALDNLELSATAIHGWDVVPRVVLDRDLVTLLGAFAGSASGAGLFDDPEVVAALVRVQDAVEQGRTLLSGEYRRRTVLGVDAAWALDPVVLKLDVAGTLSRTLYTRELEPVSLPWINAVVGLEYARGEDLQVLVEGFAVTVPGVPSNERLLYLEADRPPPTAQNVGQRTVVLPGAAAAVRAAWLEGDLRAELLAAVTFTRGDLVLMPRLAWRYAPDRQVGLGALIVEGQGGGYGAANDTADQVFVSWRISS